MGECVAKTIWTKPSLKNITLPFAAPDGGQGVRTLKNYKNIGSLSNTGPNPLKISKIPSQPLMLDHHRPARETPFKWRLSGGPILAFFSCIWSYLPSSTKKQNKKIIRVGPPLTELSGSAHGYSATWKRL